MANPVHVRLANTARTLIKKNGRTVTLRSFTETGPSYDPTLTPVDTNVTAVDTGNVGTDRANGLILATDRQYLLDADVVPADDGKVVDGGKEYDIISVDSVAPGEVGIIFKLICRL